MIVARSSNINMSHASASPEVSRLKEKGNELLFEMLVKLQNQKDIVTRRNSFQAGNETPLQRNCRSVGLSATKKQYGILTALA
jgi:hypothetical protein